MQNTRYNGANNHRRRTSAQIISLDRQRDEVFPPVPVAMYLFCGRVQGLHETREVAEEFFVESWLLKFAAEEALRIDAQLVGALRSLLQCSQLNGH